jgi:hypothetical protein
MDEKTLQKYDVVIVDEDIILSSIASNQCVIPVSLLEKMRKYASMNAVYDRLYQKIEEVFKAIETKTLFKLHGFEWGNKNGKKNKKEENDCISDLADIPSFCSATHFMYRKRSKEMNLSEDCIVFLKPFNFKNIKHIMVSATVDKDVCGYCFGNENVSYYECKTARYEGTLNQYYDKSMSRACIDRNLGILNMIRAWSGFQHMITFKKYGIGDLYFGNAVGCDYLKGENINVVGTPYKIDFVYKLLAFTLGFNVDENAEMEPCPVRHNGYQFRFNTFGEEQKELRKIHFWMIESELEQAVGRARLLRWDCTVNLFSRFPLRQAVMKESEYDKFLPFTVKSVIEAGPYTQRDEYGFSIEPKKETVSDEIKRCPLSGNVPVKKKIVVRKRASGSIQNVISTGSV